jgi:hypothetical protein
MVIGMISYGSQKPKRAEFCPLLNTLVDELIELEHGIDVCLPSQTNTRFSSQLIMTRVGVYLIGIVADKPAQSMIQNLTESGGFYGCGKCQVIGKKIKLFRKLCLFNNYMFLIYLGESVRAGKGHIRCFPFDSTNPPNLRSNKTYDEAIKMLNEVY